MLPIGEERAKAAFTLAEVLITLGIIGVVAAVTLPALIQNYQKKTYVEGLKVAYTTLNQAMKQAMATDGVERFQDTTLFKTCEWSNMTAGLTYAGDGKFDGSDLGIKACENELSKYLKKVEYIPLTAVRAGYDGDSAVTLTGASCSKDIMGKFATFSLNDRNSCNLINNGTFLIMNSMVMQTVFIDHSYYFGDIYIDVNGQNGPNTYGRDTFKFVVLENGAVEPWYSIQRAKASAKDSNSPLSEKTYYGNPSMSVEALDAKYCNPKGCSSEVSACGKNCAAKIMYENWQMNY